MKTHFIYTIRSILKNRINSFINITGLSISIACCLLFFLFINNELSHDKFHVNGDRIYRVTYSTEESNNQSYQLCLHQYELAEKLKNEVPQIRNASAFRIGWCASLKYHDKVFDERLGIVEPDFLKMFSFPIIAGNTKSFFQNPDEVIITEDLARKLLGNDKSSIESLVGKPIEILNVKDKIFTITGILAPIPSTSSLQFSALIDYRSQWSFSQSSNDFGNSSIYVELNSKEEQKIAETNSILTIQKFYQKKIAGLQTEGVLLKTDDCFIPRFQKLSDIYLGSNYNNQYEATSKIIYSLILAGIGLLILFIACSNFILLSLGQSFTKIKEVGVRKVLGARLPQLISQYGAETALLSMISVCVGILLSYFTLPYFSQLCQCNFGFNFFSSIKPLLFILTIYLLIVFFCSLPLFSFSKGKPSLMLRKITFTTGKNRISNLFITFQYVLSMVLIIATLFIYKQVNFMKDKSIGLDTKNIMKIEIPDDLGDEKAILIKEKIRNNKNILSIAGSDRDFLEDRSTYGIKNEIGDVTNVRFIRIDNDYIKTMGLVLLEGNDFSENDLRKNNNEIIVNEQFLSGLNLQDAVGKYVDVIDLGKVRIKGIVRNFHYDSMKEIIQPLALIANTNFESINYLFIKFPVRQADEIISLTQNYWKEISPGRTLRYSFFDEELQTRYQDEERWAKIVSSASFLAILISALGLWGLSLMVMNQKIKEIGIRKVNGARISEVLIMLNKDFLTWVVIAFVIATPIAYFMVHQWLEGFAFKTGLSWWIFVLAGLLALVIALLTVSWQSWRAATRNPVEALRYE